MCQIEAQLVWCSQQLYAQLPALLCIYRNGYTLALCTIFLLFFLKIGLISSLTSSKNRMGALLSIVYMGCLLSKMNAVRDPTSPSILTDQHSFLSAFIWTVCVGFLSRFWGQQHFLTGTIDKNYLNNSPKNWSHSRGFDREGKYIDSWPVPKILIFLECTDTSWELCKISNLEQFRMDSRLLRPLCHWKRHFMKTFKIPSLFEFSSKRTNRVNFQRQPNFG